MTRRKKIDWNSMVLADVKERVRQYQRTWFNNRLRPGKIYEEMARELLATLHLSTRRENVVNLQLLLANLRVVEDRVSLLSSDAPHPLDRKSPTADHLGHAAHH